MSEINLIVTITPGATLIPNIFIEKFMNTASAAHLRFYLYLMYHSQDHNTFSFTDACDFLEDSEKDIKRSINYWEKQGVLSITRTGSYISSITVTPLTNEPLTCNVAPTDTPIPNTPAIPTTEELDLTHVIKTITEFSSRLLSSSEIEFLCELNERHHFSTELIIYLYEYCCQKKGINNFSYIEKVAIAWAEKGFKTANEARNEVDTYNRENATVMKAFGLSRLPGTLELQFINTWFHTYNLPADLIIEACNRTMLQLSKPDFKYTNGTLSRWFKNNIKTLEDVKEDDKRHHINKQLSNAPINKPVNNRFTNFEQRNYNASEMNNITKNLLNAQ